MSFLLSAFVSLWSFFFLFRGRQTVALNDYLISGPLCVLCLISAVIFLVPSCMSAFVSLLSPGGRYCALT